MKKRKSVVPENIHSPPAPQWKGFAVWHPLPCGFSKIGPQNLQLPLPSGISKIFAHPLEILLSLIITKVSKEVVLFPRMPNFVSFIYYLFSVKLYDRYVNSLCKLLMRSSQRQILFISCNFFWTLQFCKWNAWSRRKHNCITFLALRQEESNTWRSII